MKILLYLGFKLLEIVIGIAIYLGLCKIGSFIELLLCRLYEIPIVNSHVWYSPFYIAVTAALLIVLAILISLLILLLPGIERYIMKLINKILNK